ncbi:hypothetical protein MC378_10460 [Polaribacter sp. MSW13]|uniref:Uncharacterized protein n=1 Tax=Polaribacter marinus TaxID=2916838 RepID=A0A9X2ALS7_9FLAO|nr:hypothetical protein [Polaribacter marinus]MCI2229590.1 hypothetical protein [Polaribacter marinus]
MEKDILLDETGDLAIANGDFIVGESLDQEVAALLQMNKGELKEYPIIGTDLIRLINSNTSAIELKQIIKTELKRDGKSYQELKERIQLKTE